MSKNKLLNGLPTVFKALDPFRVAVQPLTEDSQMLPRLFNVASWRAITPDVMMSSTFVWQAQAPVASFRFVVHLDKVGAVLIHLPPYLRFARRPLCPCCLSLRSSLCPP
jgi:hypothetical protein